MAQYSEKEMLMRRMSAAQFAEWETHIYLDTHPNDDSAMDAHDKYGKKYEMLKKEYESKYGPVDAMVSPGTHRFAWINDPWPWEMEANY